MLDPGDGDPITPAADGVILRVRAKPRASKSRVLGVREGSVEVAIAAPPVDGEANAELVRTLARHLGVPRSSVTIESGEAGRTKRVRIVGISAEGARGRLAAPIDRG